MSKSRELVKELRTNLNKLSDDIITDTEKIDNIISKWQSQQFHSYSFFNMSMLYTQKPDFELVASYKKWQEEGRQVKKGSKSLRVLAPVTYKKENDKTGEEETKLFFRPVPVFDISQTEGKKLKFVENNDLIKSDKEIDIGKYIGKCGVPVAYKQLKGRGQTNGKLIHLNMELETNADKLCTLIHEIAHIELKHIGSNTPTNIKELEAESISYIVSTAMGVKNEKSKAYIKNWNPTGVEKEFKGRGTNIIKVAYKIYQKLNK